MTIAYVYKWTHIPTLKWYIGSRCQKGCHPNDGYICSSRIVKPMIQNNPNEWIREIIATGKQKEMAALEIEILECVDAMHDPRSFNQSNGNGPGWNKIVGVPRRESTKEKIRQKNIEHNLKYGTRKGYKHSKETKQKIKEARVKQKNTMWNGPLAEEYRKRHIERMSKRIKSLEEKEKIKQAHLGAKRSDESRQRMREGHARKKPLQCPHCLRHILPGNYHRWHGDNCKQNEN